MRETLIISLLGLVLSPAVASIVVACLNRRWQKKDTKDTRLDAITNALRILMIDKVREDVKDAVYDGAITPSRRDEIKDEYQAYKALGGNGHLDADMNTLDGVPTKYE